jgi:hypothetical protein
MKTVYELTNQPAALEVLSQRARRKIEGNDEPTIHYFHSSPAHPKQRQYGQKILPRIFPMD